MRQSATAVKLDKQISVNAQVLDLSCAEESSRLSFKLLNLSDRLEPKAFVKQCN